MTGEGGARVVGRSEEFDVLVGAMHRAAGGTFAAVVLDGEAGIGKSHLVRAILDHASARGFTAVYGRADEIERGRPLAALLEVVASIGEPTTGPFTLAGDRGGSAWPSGLPVLSEPPVENTVPHSGERGDAPPDDPHPRDFELIDAIIDRLEGRAARTPLAVALEDLQWADEATLTAIGTMRRRLAHHAVLLLLSHRTDPGSGQLVRMVDLLGPSCRPLPVGPMSGKEVEELVAVLLGAEPGPRLLARLSAASGNPLFITELVSAFRDEGTLSSTDGRVETSGPEMLPPSLRLTVIRRLSALPQTTLSALRFAAVLGSAFAVADLAAVSARSAVELVSDLDPALRAGLIEGAEESALGFRHDLIREAVYLDMPAAIRLLLHRDVARALEQAGRPTFQVAAHMMLGATPGDVEAGRWLYNAAGDTWGFSRMLSVQLLERALDVLPAGDPFRPSAEVWLADQLASVGRFDDADRRLDRLAAHHRQPDFQASIRAAQAHVLMARGRLAEARDAWVGIGEDPQTPLAVQARAQCNAGRVSVGLGDIAAAERHSRRAVVLAESCGLPQVLANAHDSLALVAASNGAVVEAIDHGRRAVAIGEPVGLAGGIHAGFGLVLIDADEFDEAELMFLTALQRSQARGVVAPQPLAHWGRAGVLYFRGRWDDAIAEAEAGLEAMAEGGDRQGTLMAHAIIGRIHLHRGRVAAASAAVASGERELESSGPSIGLDALCWVRGLLHAARGEDAAALEQMKLAWDLWAGLRYLLTWRSVAPDLVRSAVRAGDLGLARGIAREAGIGAERARGVPSALGAGLRCAGLAEADPELLLESAAAYARSPRKHDHAMVLAEASFALAAAGRPSEARALLDESVSILRHLGADHDVLGVQATARSFGLRARQMRPSRPRSGWQSLTASELAVARLVAEGLTNKQIAERLYVSSRTVQTHLSHVFAKLTIASRAELAAIVARNAS